MYYMTSDNLFSDVDFSHISNNISKKSIFKYKDKYKNYIYGDSVLSIHNNTSRRNRVVFKRFKSRFIYRFTKTNIISMNYK